MQQLTGLDHMFFALDSATTNGVLGGLLRFEKPEPGQPLPDRAFMRHRLEERLPHIPPMNKRVVDVPFMMDHSYLARVDRIDIEKHLHSLTLQAPGSDVELAAEISRIMSTDLDTDGGPLWDLTIIDGLEGGGIAQLLRIHHGVVDGSTMPVIWDLFSDEPRGEMHSVPPPADLPEPLLGAAEMYARIIPSVVWRPVSFVKAQAHFAKWVASRMSQDGLTTLPALMAKFIPGGPGKAAAGLINMRQRAAGQPEIVPYIPTINPPRTRFNGRASSKRQFVFSEMSLAEVKGVGKEFGATLNNTVVALCSGAMRRYLDANGGIPDEPLIVCVPVSLRHDAIEDPWANHVHMMFAPFPTNVDDPIKRLQLVTKDLKDAKSSFDSMPTELFREMSAFMPRDMMGWALQAMIRMPDALSRAPWNVVVSNVRGSSEPAYMNGLQVEGYWPASFLSIGGGINITLQSYRDKICFGFIGAPDKTGDLWPLVHYMEEALQELKVSAARHHREQQAAITHPRAPRRAAETAPESESSAPQSSAPESGAAPAVTPSAAPADAAESGPDEASSGVPRPRGRRPRSEAGPRRSASVTTEEAGARPVRIVRQA